VVDESFLAVAMVYRSFAPKIKK